jgi:hypothetical protein
VTTESGTPEQESGGSLREKLESTIAANKALEAELAKNVAEKFRHVKPEDLTGVSYHEMAAKASQLEQAREEQRKQILLEALNERGIQGDDLDAALAKVTGTNAGDQAQATSRLASVGTLQGTPPGPPQTEGLWGRDRIRAAVEKK